MRFRFFLCLFVCLTVLLYGCQSTPSNASTDTTYQTTNSTLSAVITSDLHYVHDDSGFDNIVPMMHYSNDFIECLVNQTIAQNPDVFIATGDVTNDGASLDFQYLARHLQKFKEHGITVIITTGNHDYGSHQISDFETYIFPLLDIQSRDTDSLSYTTIVNDICFIAMDDDALSSGSEASFSSSTMEWLEAQLISAKQSQQKIIFLSHHSVLFNRDNLDSRYTIENSNLIDLLTSYNVRLCFTGHQHTQSRLQYNDIHEIISSMPKTGSHQFGTCTITNDLVTYQTQNIDFETYANKELYDFYISTQNTSLTTYEDTYRSIFASYGFSQDEQDGIFQLFARFITYAQDGVLARHYEEIKNDPYYELMIKGLSETNYGPWIVSLMEEVPLDASYLQFTW